MDDVYSCLRVCRTLSHILGDTGIAWSVLLAIQTLATVGHTTFALLAISIAFPFFVALCIKVTGNMFEIIIAVVEEAELNVREIDQMSVSMHEISHEVRSRRSQPGA